MLAENMQSIRDNVFRKLRGSVYGNFSGKHIYLDYDLMEFAPGRLKEIYFIFLSRSLSTNILCE